MKHIATTLSGNILLECSEREYRALLHLEEVATGKQLGFITDNWRDPERLVLGEFTAYFEAIWHWMMLKSTTNQLQAAVDRLNEALQVSTQKANDTQES